MLTELVVLNHLKSLLNVPVAMEHSADLQDRYVIVERIGGSIADHIRSSSFAIQSYGKSLLDACQINEEVKRAMDSIIESSHVSKCVLDSDYNYTDQTTKQYRYQAVYDLWFFD